MIDLAQAAQLLVRELGSHVDAPYVPGKTTFRDVLCRRAGVSQMEAEEVCDSLERAGVIAFHHSESTGDRWTIDPNANPSTTKAGT